MALQSTTLMGMMHEKMNWLTQRQSVLAQNIANANTPDYAARDLKALDFKKSMSQASQKFALKQTHVAHVQGNKGANGGSHDVRKSDGGYEISPDGNRVVLEEQMMKLNTTNSDHNLTTSLFKKYTGLYRIALKGQ